MANWCSNVFAIYPRNESDLGKAQLKRLFAQLRKLTQIDYPEGTDSHNWYGLLSVMRGRKESEIAARGSIDDIQWEEDHILMQTETAWEPQDDIVADMLDCKECSELEYVFIAEEGGNEIYINTDDSGRFFRDRYVLDYDFTEVTGTPIEGGVGCDRDYYSTAESLLTQLHTICDRLHSWSYDHSGDGLEIFFCKWSDLKGTPEEQCDKILKEIKDYMEKYNDHFGDCYICYHKFERS